MRLSNAPGTIAALALGACLLLACGPLEADPGFGQAAGMAGAQAVCPTVELPAAFSLESVFFSWGSDFSIRAEGDIIGSIEQEMLSWSRTFKYFDANHQLVATASARTLSWGVKVDVFDCNDDLLGTLDEQVYKSWFSTRSTYSVLNADGEEIASSQKADWLTTDFKLEDTSGTVVAEMHRPWSLGQDTWNVTVHDADALDSRLYIMIGAFKSAADRQRRAQAAAASDN